MPTLHLHQITKEYAQRRVLRGVEGKLGSGTYVLLGPNGAGKSTLLHILSTQSLPTDGYFTLDQMDSRHHLDQIRRHLGMVGHRSYLYPALTLRENLAYYASLYHLPDAKEEIIRLSEFFAMAEVLDQPVRTFSRGMQQRAAFLRAILHKPACLLLDEPFTGLDPRGIELVISLLDTWREEGRLVLLTTHDLHLAARIADHLLLLSRGRLLASLQGEFTAASLEEHYRQHFPATQIAAQRTAKAQ